MKSDYRQRDSARRLLQSALADAFPEDESLRSFLNELGLRSVVRAVPRSRPEVYRRELIHALDRRDLINADLLGALVAHQPGVADSVERVASALGIEMSSNRLPAERSIDALDALPGIQEVQPTYDSLPFSYLSAGMKVGRAVAVVRASAFGSTGWLVGPDLLIAPGYLFEGPLPTDLRADFDFDDASSEVRSVPISGVVFHDQEAMLLVLRLAKPLHDRAPIALRLVPMDSARARIALICHPMLATKRLLTAESAVSEGGGNRLLYSLPTEPGSAGAPVLDADWRVFALHLGHQRVGTTTMSFGLAVAAMLDILREQPTVWRELVAAQIGLKTVHPALRQRLRQAPSGQEATARIPFIVEVLDESTQLDQVPDLEVQTRSGEIVTATGSWRSLDALTRLHGVLAVEPSLTAGASECALSIPHIRALEVQEPPAGLGERGDRALIGVIDSGIDVLHAAFRDAAGRSRILAFWDQRTGASDGGHARSVSPAGQAAVTRWGLPDGTLYVQEDIQHFIDGDPLPADFPAAVNMRHGTTVCSIAAGRRTGDPAAGFFAGGVAPEADLVVVRYDLRDTTVGYNIGHIHAIELIERVAVELERPVVINISNGMNTGAHNGTSPVERRCERFTDSGDAPGRVIVKSAGNESRSARHAKVDLAQGVVQSISWIALTRQGPAAPAHAANDVLEGWFSGANTFRFRVLTPDGAASPWLDREFAQIDELLANGNRLQGSLDQFHRSGGAQLHLEIAPGERGSLEEGRWTLEIEAQRVVNLDPFHLWVEALPHRNLSFADSVDPRTTITIPGTAPSVIVVGAVHVGDPMQPHADSSQGPTRHAGHLEKPEIVAPGVRIRAALADSGTAADPEAPAGEQGNAGTSFAAPHVAGAIALLLSARAKKPAQPQFNALQIRQALLVSARHFSGNWNPRTGYGGLDVLALFNELKP